MNWGPVFQYPLCKTVNFTEHVDFDEITPVQLIMYLGDIENLGLTLNFIDKRKALTRTLLQTYLAYDGPSIAISDLMIESTRFIRIMLKMFQHIDTERNEESKCKNYPYENYLNYNDCDQNYVQNIVKDNLNITPFWATQVFENVTKIRIV